MSNDLIPCLVALCFTFMPMCWSIGDYFQQKAFTEMRNRGDKTLLERWREKRNKR